jgi:multiple antibiotic resistance protein
LLVFSFYDICSVFTPADILTITFTLFAVIDVIGALPVIIGLKNRQVQFKPGTATLFAGFLMIVFLFVGEQLLNIMGVLGIELVLGINLFRHDPGLSKSGSIVPLGFPLLAGSGTLTTIMSLRSLYTIPNIIVGVILNLIFVYIVLMSVDWLEQRIGESVLGAMKKFFGVILIAIAVKIFVAAIFLFKVPHP